MRSSILLGLCACAALRAALPADAQFRSRDTQSDLSYNRPSTISPSQYLGGRFTRFSERVSSLDARTDYGALGTLGRPQYRSGFESREQRYGGFGVGESSAGYDAFSAPRTGLLHAPVLRSNGLNSPRYGGGRFSSVGSRLGLGFGGIGGFSDGSEFLPDMSLDSPLFNYGRPLMPAPTGALYSPREGQTRYQQYFDLPSAASPGTNSAPPGATAPPLSEFLNRRNQERLVVGAREALDLFRAATEKSSSDPGCAECHERVARATYALQGIRDIDPTAALPCLLLMHLAMEQDKITTAQLHLFDAVRRDPDIFLREARNSKPFDAYFGDATGEPLRSATLSAQMSRYARVGERTDDDVLANILEGYCSWRLGDLARAGRALQKAIEVSDREQRRETAAVAAALRAAVTK